MNRESERPGWRAGAGNGGDDGKGVTANIARPDTPDNQPADELERIHVKLRRAVPRLVALGLAVGFAAGVALSRGLALWVLSR